MLQGPHFKPTPAEARPLGLPGYPTVRRPVQSYEFAGLERVTVDERCSVMLTQRLRGVLRRAGSCAVTARPPSTPFQCPPRWRVSM